MTAAQQQQQQHRRTLLPASLTLTQLLCCALQSNEWNSHVIQLCRYRHTLVSRETDVAAIEAAVSCGEIEELVEQAEEEYDLLVNMNEIIKPWEPDPDGDALFAKYHPSFGQTQKDFDLTLPDEEKTWGDIDAKLGIKAPAAPAAPAPSAPEAAATAPKAA